MVNAWYRFGYSSFHTNTSGPCKYYRLIHHTVRVVFFWPKVSDLYSAVELVKWGTIGWYGIFLHVHFCFWSGCVNK